MRKILLSTCLLVLGVGFCWGQQILAPTISLIPLKGSIDSLSKEINKLNAILTPTLIAQQTKTVCAYVILNEDIIIPLKSNNSHNRSFVSNRNSIYEYYIVNERFSNMKKIRSKWYLKHRNEKNYFKHMLIDSLKFLVTDNTIKKILLFSKYNITSTTENYSIKIIQNEIQLSQLIDLSENKGKGFTELQLYFNRDEYINLSDLVNFYTLDKSCTTFKNGIITISNSNPFGEFIKQ